MTRKDYIKDGSDRQHLYLRKGSVIYIVSYTGSLDLRDKADIFADDMGALQEEE